MNNDYTTLKEVDFEVEFFKEYNMKMTVQKNKIIGQINDKTIIVFRVKHLRRPWSHVRICTRNCGIVRPLSGRQYNVFDALKGWFMTQALLGKILRPAERLWARE